MQARLQQAAKLLGIPQKDLDKKLADDDKSFVWIQRQVDAAVARQVADLNIKGIYQRRDFKPPLSRRLCAAAHVAGFTNVEEQGQEGVELAFDHSLAGKAKPAPRDQ